MIKREPLLTEQYFDAAILRRIKFIAETEDDAKLSADEIRLDMVYFDLFNDRLRLLSLKYSRGYPIAKLLPDFVALVEALERYKQFPGAEDFFFNGEQDEYMQAVALLSLGLLLGVERAVFARLVAALGLAGQDFVLEWLAGRRLPGRPATTRLLFPKTYARLRDALQAPAGQQAGLLKGFLAGWYESLDTVWYNIHAHRPDAAGFVGYWCWEAAAAALWLGVDDRELRDMPYYPADLAAFARARPERPA